jgi:hypothetical protein
LPLIESGRGRGEESLAAENLSVRLNHKAKEGAQAETNNQVHEPNHSPVQTAIGAIACRTVVKKAATSDGACGSICCTTDVQYQPASQNEKDEDHCDRE